METHLPTPMTARVYVNLPECNPRNQTLWSESRLNDSMGILCIYLFMLIYRYIVQKWIIIPVKLENMSYYRICQLSGDIYYFTRLLRVCLDNTELVENRALVLQGYFFIIYVHVISFYFKMMSLLGGWFRRGDEGSVCVLTWPCETWRRLG